MENNLPAFLKRSSERLGYRREFYLEKNMPTLPSNVVVMPFYGDMRSTFVLSSFLLKRYKEWRRDKYIILCSWPGFQGMFPYVDEYWYKDDVSAMKTLAMEANNFYNASSLAVEINRSLYETFSEVVTPEDLKPFYFDGFGDKFWEIFKEPRRFLPEIPAANKLSESFKSEVARKSGIKVVVHPVTRVRSWQKGRNLNLPISKDFWVALLSRLLEEGYVPTVYQNQFTYDMSKDFIDSCIYLVPKTVTDVLCAMYHIGRVLDVYSGISRLAIAARTPFICVDERARFMTQKEYEIDDLCCDKINKQYIFSFSSMLMSGTAAEWRVSILDNIIAKLKILESHEGDRMSTSELDEPVSYDRVRNWKAKRLGVTFIKSSKNK